MSVDSPASIWLMTGAKGGCGATLLTTSLAWALAEQGRQAIVLDFDLLEGQAAMHLCEANAGPTVDDALRAGDRLDATLLDTLLLPCGPRLRLLASPGPDGGGVQADAPALGAGLLRLCTLAAEQADHVLVDLPMRTVLSGVADDLLERADRRLLVAEPSLSAAYNARRCLQMFEERGSGVDEVVLNRCHRGDAMSVPDMHRALDRPGRERAWRMLPRADEAAAMAVHQGLAVGRVQPRDPLARALKAWAQEVAAA